VARLRTVRPRQGERISAAHEFPYRTSTLKSAGHGSVALARAADTDRILILTELRLVTLRQVESPDEDEIWAAHKIISCTPPASLLGAGVKLRLLLDRDLGLEIGTGADDMISLRQVAELIERLVRRVG